MIERDHTDKVTFLGFTDWNDSHSEEPAFANWKEAQAKIGVSSFTELDMVEKVGGKMTIYAVFTGYHEEFNRNTSELEITPYNFCAYRFRGRWCVGSSARPVSLERS